MSLGRRGYVIEDVLDKKIVAEIRADLTVAPVVEGGGGGYGPQRPKKHRYYMTDKSGSRMAVPRFYAASKDCLLLREPRHDFGVVENCSENLAFCGSLKADLRQPEAVDATLAAMRATGGAMLSLAPGQGKCFARGTPVLMYDGSVRAVEDVGVGDVVMGDDSTPRVVASLGRGREMMYDIVPADGGRPFTCNESHVLALIHAKFDAKIDIDLQRYVGLSKSTQRNLHMYRRPPRGSIVRTPFEIVKKSIDEYYGFTLAGANHRFLLADFTVVHNTVCALSIACTLGLKTLIVVHKEFLMNQWIERIGQFVPAARVGRLQQGTMEVGDRDVVVAMIHSIALRAYPPQVFDGFGLTIVDESHHVSAPVFSQAMFAANSPYVLGLTATPERKDGLQRVLHWFLGDIAFQTVRTERADVVVDAVRFDLELPPEGPPVQRRTGKVCMPTLITMLTENASRNELILDIVRKHAAAGRKIIVLSDRRTHCDLLHRRLGAEYPSGLYVGGMSESDLNASATRAVILATYAMATEGLDIPALDTLVLATPKSDVVQASGRILRENSDSAKKKVHAPLIVDVVDAFGMFYAQFNKRRKFYVASGFEIRQSGKQAPPETVPRRAIEGYGFVADDD